MLQCKLWLFSCCVVILLNLALNIPANMHLITGTNHEERGIEPMSADIPQSPALQLMSVSQKEQDKSTISK